MSYLGYDITKEKILKRMSSALSSKFGIFKTLHYNRCLNHDPKTFLALIRLRENNRTGGELMTGAGSSINHYSAAIRAMGEATERYCASFLNSDYQNLSYKDLCQNGLHALDPETISFYADFQYDIDKFHLKKFTQETQIDWMMGKNLSKGKNIFLPLDLCKFASNQIFEGTSNGMAAGLTEEESILRGLLELIERDAFAFMWWTRTGMPAVKFPISGNCEKIKRLNLFFNQQGGKVKVLCAKTDLHIPVFISIFEGASDQEPPFLVAAACKLDPLDGIIKSLEELSHARLFINQAKTTPLLDELPYDEKINNFVDGVRLFLRKDYAEKTRFLHNGESVEIEHIMAKLTSDGIDKIKNVNLLIQHLSLCNIDVFAAELTTPDIKRIGLSVWKVISPHLLQANAAHKYRNWGNPRLFKLTKELNPSKSIESVQDLNPLPHPFP